MVNFSIYFIYFKYIAVYVEDYTDDACLGEIDLEYKYIAEGRLIRICP